MINYNIEKILVPLDLSEPSLNALDAAMGIAARHNASIVLLNVVESVMDKPSLESSFQNLDILNTSNVFAALSGTAESVTGNKPVIVREKGNVTDVVLKTALKEKADLIVIGTHGASGIRQGYVGSNTYQVIKHSSCPVLTIPPRRKISSFSKVLFPIRPLSGALLRYHVLCHFLSPSSIIDVVGLAHKKEEINPHILDRIIAEVADHLENDKVQAIASWSSGNTIADDVLRLTQQNNSDLIVISSMLDATSKPYFLGPHTQKIINCSKIPLLSIKKIGVPALA
ncbi:MAG TPA: universal stress protein [Chitinophagaceae bacterium]|nr:universal stress protein [Chitinophagaceae bacterium]